MLTDFFVLNRLGRSQTESLEI